MKATVVDRPGSDRTAATWRATRWFRTHIRKARDQNLVAGSTSGHRGPWGRSDDGSFSTGVRVPWYPPNRVAGSVLRKTPVYHALLDACTVPGWHCNRTHHATHVGFAAPRATDALLSAALTVPWNTALSIAAPDAKWRSTIQSPGAPTRSAGRTQFPKRASRFSRG